MGKGVSIVVVLYTFGVSDRKVKGRFDQGNDKILYYDWVTPIVATRRKRRTGYET
jgi:hypothetical protein